VDFDLQVLPDGAAALAAVLVLAALAYDARHVGWKALAFGPILGRLLGASVTVMLLWTMSAKLRPGFGLHLLGATAAVLVFGRPRALLALAIGSLTAWLSKGAALSAWFFNFALLAVLPAWLSAGSDRWIQRRLPNHFFVFIFVNGCLTAAATVLTVGLLATLTLGLGGEPIGPLLEDYLPYFLLLSFAEAWLTGMTITVLVVYRPGWVASFDDRRYLANK